MCWPARCPGHPGTRESGSRRYPSLAAVPRDGRPARRGGPSIPLVPLLAPWVAVVVVAKLLPEAGGVLQHQVDAAHPLGGLPEVQVGDQQSGRSTVLGRKCLSVVLIGDPGVAVEQILQRQVVL